MTIWGRTFGVEPTRDPEEIVRWAVAGATLAIALSEPVLDGASHPAVMRVDGDTAVTTCDVTNHSMRHLVTDQLALEEVRSWGCTFVELREAEG